MPFDDCGGDPRDAFTPTYARLTEDDVRLEPKPGEAVRYGCGHDAPERYGMFVKTDAEEVELKIDRANPHYREKCGACRRDGIIGVAIRCTGCRRPILAGQDVTTMRGGVRCLSCTDPMQVDGTWTGTHVEPIKISLFGPMC